MDVNFPSKNGCGFEKSVPPSHNTKECLDLIKLLLTYDPEERITATQALRHEFFRDLWEIDQIKDFQGSMYKTLLKSFIFIKKNFNTVKS